MVAVSDIQQKQASGKTKHVDSDLQDMQQSTSMRRFIIAASATALCMAAVGLWVIPSADSAAQLIKLVASVVMLLGALILFDGLNEKNLAPEVQIDAKKRQVRVYQYDVKGNATLEASYNIDEMRELTMRNRTLCAKNAQGERFMEIPVESEDAERAIRSMMPRA